MEKIVHSVGSCTRKIEIKVSSQEIQSKYNSMFASLSKKADIPGFRQGKVPQNILEKRYKDAIIEDLTDEYLQLGYKEAMSENDLIPMIPPVLDGEAKLVIGQDFIATIYVDVKPPIELREYKNLPLVRRVLPVSDVDVENALKDLLKRSGSLQPISDRPSQTGDYALIEFTHNENEQTSKHVLLLDNKSSIDLLGKVVNEETEGHFEFSLNYPDRELAGKSFTAKAKIIELKELVPAELDEEFISQFGDEIKDETALREGIRKDIEASRKEAAEVELRNQARAELSSRNPVDFTEKIIERAVIGTIKNYWNIEDLNEEQLSEIKNNIRPNTIRSLSVDFLLEEVAKQENIEVSEDEVKAHIAEIARANRVQPDTLYRRWKKEDKIDDVKQDIIAEKAITFIVQNAEIKEE